MASPHRHAELAIVHAKRQAALLAAGRRRRGGRSPRSAPTQVTSRLQSRGHVSQPGVVAQHGPAVGRQGGQAIRPWLWAMCCRLPKPPRWASPTHVITPTFGRAQFGQRGNLAGPACPQFQHGVVVVRLDRRHAQRDAEVVVEVLRAGRAAEPRLQHRVDHLPGGGLAGAAGHGDHRAGALAAFPACPVVQGPLRVVDADGPLIRRARRRPWPPPRPPPRGERRRRRTARPRGWDREAPKTPSPGSIFRLSLTIGPSDAVEGSPSPSPANSRPPITLQSSPRVDMKKGSGVRGQWSGISG